MSSWLLHNSGLTSLQEEMDTRKETSHFVQGWEKQDSLVSFSSLKSDSERTVLVDSGGPNQNREGLQRCQTKAARG